MAYLYNYKLNLYFCSNISSHLHQHDITSTAWINFIKSHINIPYPVLISASIVYVNINFPFQNYYKGKDRKTFINPLTGIGSLKRLHKIILAGSNSIQTIIQRPKILLNINWENIG